MSYRWWIAATLVFGLNWGLAGCVARTTFEAKEREVAGAMTSVEQARATSRGLNEELERVTKERAVLQHELDSTRAELWSSSAEKDRELALLRKGLTEGQEQINALKGTVAEGNQQIAGLRSTLAKRDQELQRMWDLFRETEQTVGRLQTALVDRDQGAAHLETTLTQKETAIADLRQLALEREEEVARLKATYQQLVTDLRKEIEAGEIKVTQYENLLRVNLVEKILFDSGKVDIKPRGLEILKRVGGILKGSDGKQLRIEGHTDNVPIGTGLTVKYPTNWELSAARAAAVTRYFENAVKIPPTKLAACGFGEYQPVAANDSEAGRAENRRIEILLAPLSRGAILP